ncbi:hypothetical protein BH10PLA1_BH10PLA1_17150 [soil metagenome]
MENDGVRRACIAYFCLFIVLVVGPFTVVPLVGPTAALFGLVLLIIAAVVFIREMPKFLILLMIVGLPLAALLYLSVCFREIRQLRQPYKAMGFIGCCGLATIGLLAVIFAVAQG